MAYTRRQAEWKNYPNTTTPIRAEDLDAIEAGLEDAAGVADTALGLASTAASTASAATITASDAVATAEAASATAQSAYEQATAPVAEAVDLAVTTQVSTPTSTLNSAYAPIKGSSIPRTLARLRAGQAVKVSILGDSKLDPTTAGNSAGDAVTKAFALIDVWSNSTVTINNQADSGDTMAVQTINGNVTAAAATAPDVVFIEIGTNDSNTDAFGAYAAGYPMAASLASLERAIAYLRDANEACEVVLIATTPYVPASSSNPKIVDYNRGVRELAATVGAEFVDGYKSFTDYGADWSPLLLDSTHRNAAGNDRLAAEIAAHFPANGPTIAAALAPRAAKGRYGIDRIEKAKGNYGYVTFAATASTANGSYALTGTGWTVSGSSDISSTVGDAFVLTGTKAIEFLVNVDLSATSSAIVDVYLDNVLQATNVDLHAQSGKNNAYYWLAPFTGLDGNSHSLKLVVKSGTLKIASSAILCAPDAAATSFSPPVVTSSVAATAVTTTMTISYQNLVAPTTITKPTGWGSYDLILQGWVAVRSSGSTTAVRQFDLSLREASAAISATRSVNLPQVAATTLYPLISFNDRKGGLTGNASVDLIAKVDNATDTIQVLRWYVNATLVRVT